jgi:multiple sugar transport system substrate-binding protein
MRKLRELALVSLALALVAMPVLAAGQQEAAEGEADEVELRFTWWGDTARHAKYNEIADIFEERNPGVTIIREFGSWGDYWDRLATQTAGGNPPDIAGMHVRYVSNFARRGALLPLDPYVEDGTIDLSNFPETVRSIGVLDGELLMVAQGYTVSGWFYNSEIFDDLGVDYPGFDWTWAEFEATLRALRAANDSDDFWPAEDYSQNNLAFEAYVNHLGKQWFSEAGDLGFAETDVVEWFSRWQRYRDANLIPDPASLQEFGRDRVALEQSFMPRGMVALTMAPFNQLPLFQGATGAELYPVRFPHAPGSANGDPVGSSHLTISTTSENPDVAARFINFFVNDPAAVSVFKLEQGALGSTESNAVVAPLLSPVENKMLDAIQRAVPTGQPERIAPAASPEVYAEFEAAAEAVAFGQLTPEEGASQFMTRAQAILK